MALGTRTKYVHGGSGSAVSTLASNKNPDGTDYSMNVAPTGSAPAVADIGFSVTAAAGGTTLPGQACHKVTLQNRLTADDGTTAQTQSVWVVVGGVKMFELVNGQSAEVCTTNANLVTVTSFSGTSLVSGTITP